MKILIVASLLVLTSLLMAGDGSVKYTQVDGLEVKSSAVINKTLMVGNTNYSGSIVSNKTSVSLFLSGKGKKVDITMTVTRNPKTKKDTAYISLHQGKADITFSIVNGRPIMSTNEKIFDLNAMTGVGIRNLK